MIACAAPLLAVAMLALFQAGAVQGSVTDEEGKPVADAGVLFFAPAPSGGKGPALSKFRPRRMQTDGSISRSLCSEGLTSLARTSGFIGRAGQ